jgi:hypothetical protein
MTEGGAQFTLGKVHNETQRDAIHIAVAPAVATTYLDPGEDVGFVEGTERAGRNSSSAAIGIVDPFLPRTIGPGERFWIFLYPNTITSLRHQWTHPAFEQSAGRISQDDHIAKSRAWIEQHAKLLGLSDDVLMENAVEWLRDHDYFVQQGSERWRDNFNPTEFWHHYEVVTGKPVPDDDKRSFYCCTC